MDRHGAGHPQRRGGICFHGAGVPKEEMRWLKSVGKGHNGGCSRGWQMEEMRGYSAEAESNPGFGPYCRHVGVGNSQGQTGNRNISKFEVEFLDNLQELELQARMIRSENLEHKKILTRLYNLAYATHSEAKARYQSNAEKVEHQEETLGLAYPHKVRKHKVSGKYLEEINKKMEKLQKFMETKGNFVDLIA